MVYITPRETALVTQDAEKVSVQRFRLVGADVAAQPEGQKKLPGLSNYFIGNEASKWRTNIENYQEVIARGVYPGVDLVYSSTTAARAGWSTISVWRRERIQRSSHSSFQMPAMPRSMRTAASCCTCLTVSSSARALR
jgi:hypothetical protein